MDGNNFCMVSLSLPTKVVGSAVPVDGLKNSPGSRIGVPYTISAVVACSSSFHAALKPRRIVGRTVLHWLVLCALIAALSCL